MEEKIQSSMETLRWAIESFPRIAVACSFGKDSTTVVSLARRIDPKIRIFWIRTGYEFEETIRPFVTVEEFEKRHGKDLYKRDLKLCCDILKVRPTMEILGQLDAWITGLRKDETEFRRNIQMVERFEGLPVKINPIADWTKDDVWTYIRENSIPYNPLYDKGYVSLGCRPCTLAGTWGRFERAGRWRGRMEECGMHTFQYADNEK